jgi:hypothetical protein
LSQPTGSESSAGADEISPVSVRGGRYKQRAVVVLRGIRDALDWLGFLPWVFLSLIVVGWIDYYSVGMEFPPAIVATVILAEATGYLAVFNAYSAIKSADVGDKVAAAIELFANQQTQSSPRRGDTGTDSSSQLPFPPKRGT